MIYMCAKRDVRTYAPNDTHDIYIYTGLCDVDISFFSDVNLLVERASLASDSK